MIRTPLRELTASIRARHADGELPGSTDVLGWLGLAFFSGQIGRTVQLVRGDLLDADVRGLPLLRRAVAGGTPDAAYRLLEGGADPSPRRARVSTAPCAVCGETSYLDTLTLLGRRQNEVFPFAEFNGLAIQRFLAALR